MSIITKPAGGVLKGVPATLTLSKVELLAVPMVSADSYFSDSDNWNKVILKYKSSEGKQYEVVEFNATLSSPTGTFSVSEKARDEFEIQTLEIIDFDGGIFIVPRGVLTVADFDISFTSTPPVFTGTYIDWTERTNYTTEFDGGLTSDLTAPNNNTTSLIYGDNSAKNPSNGEFSIIYKINKQDFTTSDYRFLGFADSTKAYYSGFYRDTSVSSTSIRLLIDSQQTGSDIDLSAIHSNSNISTLELKITINSNSIKFFVNDILYHTRTGAFAGNTIGIIPAARVYSGMELLESSIIDVVVLPVTWNVASKTGVGTVTTGANGLITKSGGGGDYNVNVLSNETIIGDGYFEFVNSSLLNLNNNGVAIIGLAEQASLTGGYNNVIHGLYTVNNNWHEIFNGAWSGTNNTSTIGETVRFERIGSEFYIKLNGVTRWQRTISNTNPLKLSISMYTVGTGVDNATVTP